ncbi:MAG: tyrosine-type recombinase/integrase [Ketobacter sp.]|nr:tyrosine-type recombinase/integrase [Ketobacter sp.]
MNVAMMQFKQYLQRRYPGSSTTKHYMSDLNIFSRFVGDVSPKDITSKLIDQFIQEQSQQGKSATTINRRLSSLSSFIDFLIDDTEDDTWSNPVRWKRHAIKVGRHLPRDVSDETVSRLFGVIDDVRDRAMFTLMISAGLRVGEVVKLDVDEIEAIEATILSRLPVRGKGDKERIAWLTVETMVRLQQWLKQRPESQKRALFVNRRDGGRLSVSGVQYCLKQYCQQAQVQLTCHQFRHTYARRLVEHNMPIDSLAKLLGHSDLQTTQRYIDGANPAVRTDFLAAMQQMAQFSTRSGDQTSQPHFPAPSVALPDERPDPASLVDNLTHLAVDLPVWLQQQLRLHTIRRAVRWQPHRVKAQLFFHFSTLCRISRWLVTERHWSQLDQLKRTDLVAYVNARQQAGLKPRSIASELTLFRMFWRDLLNQELVSNGALLQVKAPPAGDHLPRYLTGVEFQRLAQMVQIETETDTPPDRFDRAWFYLFAHAGLRLSEALNLRLTDCDLGGQRLRIIAGKGDRDRILPMTPQLAIIVQDYLTVREPAQTNHLLIYKNAAVKTHLLPYRLRRFGQKVHIEPMTPHRLRHTLATFLINQGMPITSLQKFLGHQDINKTLIYARVYDETVQAQFASAMAQIERIVVTDWPRQIEQLNPAVMTTGG